MKLKTRYADLKISRKLTAGFLTIVLLAVLVGGAGIFSILSIERNDNLLYKEDTLSLQYAGDAGVAFMQLRYNSLKRLYAGDQASVIDAVKNVKTSISQVDKLLDQCQKTNSNSEINALLGQMQTEWGTYMQAVSKENDAALKGETVEYNADTAKLADQLRDNFTTLFEKVSAAAAAKAAQNKAESRLATMLVAVILVVSAIVSVLLSRFLSNDISAPLQMLSAVSGMLAVGDIDVDRVIQEKDRQLKYRKDEIGVFSLSFSKLIASTIEQANQARAIADGDLTTQIAVRSEGDVLGHALSELVSNFHQLASSIVSSAEQVNSGAGQVEEAS